MTEKRQAVIEWLNELDIHEVAENAEFFGEAYICEDGQIVRNIPNIE